MRLRQIPIFLIAPLGLAAALIAHGFLQTLAEFDLAARGYASRAHAALEPALFVEIALALWLAGAAMRDALTTRTHTYHRITAPPRFGMSRLTLCAALIALIAIVTLFSMEYFESGNAAFGLGWLGGALIPGAVAVTIAVAMAVGTLYLALAGHLAGFDRLVALFAAALTRFIATHFAPGPAPQRIRTFRLAARTTPVARHAGLRAPPITTR